MPCLTLQDIQYVLSNTSDVFDTFVETGTYMGETIFQMEPFFDKLHTIELSYDLYTSTKSKYSGNKIVFHCGDSTYVLPQLLPSLDKTIFWLDGHYSSGITAKGPKDCPLIEEITSISLLYTGTCIIIIDDARLFDTTDDQDWSGINENKVIGILGERVEKFYYIPSIVCEKDRMVIHVMPLGEQIK